MYVVDFSYFIVFSRTLGKFQPNLSQNILWWGGFNFIQMKGHTLFQWEMITKYQNYMTKFKNFFSRTTGPVSTKLGSEHPCVKGTEILRVRTIQFSKRCQSKLWYNLVLRKFVYWLELFLRMRLQNLRPCDCRCHKIETTPCWKAISAKRWPKVCCLPMTILMFPYKFDIFKQERNQSIM